MRLMAYRQRYPKQTVLGTAAVMHGQSNGRGPGNIAGLDERARRSGVTGHIRHESWTHPRQPIQREQVVQTMRERAA
jgi:hypothetical protein